jgi:putative copper resistance protein D
MIGIEVALRAVTFAAMFLMFGASLALVYAPAGLRREAPLLMYRSAAAAAFTASALWLLVRAGAISGQSVPGVLEDGAMSVVVRETVFGRASAARLALIAFACIVPKGPRADWLHATLAGAATASIAWNGHAVATPGYLHLGADVVHLLAAGAWVGGLIPLAWMLSRAQAADAVVLTRRFSRLGFACVLALLVTGDVNAWFLVGSFGALLHTPYGNLLLLKVALFASMLVLAGVNHFRFTPRLPNPSAVRSIVTNAGIEALLGLGAIAIVAALGVMVPAAHAAMRMH